MYQSLPRGATEIAPRGFFPTFRWRGDPAVGQHSVASYSANVHYTLYDSSCGQQRSAVPYSANRHFTLYCSSCGQQRSAVPYSANRHFTLYGSSCGQQRSAVPYSANRHFTLYGSSCGQPFLIIYVISSNVEKSHLNKKEHENFHALFYKYFY